MLPERRASALSSSAPRAPASSFPLRGRPSAKHAGTAGIGDFQSSYRKVAIHQGIDVVLVKTHEAGEESDLVVGPIQFRPALFHDANSRLE